LKVLLKENIDRLGRMGEVIEVAGGYARNYLIPRGFAIGVTRGRVKEIEEQKKVLGVKAARERDGMEAVAESIRSKPIKVEAQCSATGKLFGSVTNRQLAQVIEELTGNEIDRHKIVMDEKIRAVGTYKAAIRLHPDVTIDIEFEVQGEGFVPEEPPDEEDEAGERQEASPSRSAGADGPGDVGGTGEDGQLESPGSDQEEGTEPGVDAESGPEQTDEPEGDASESPDPDNDSDSRRE